jgi:outer membrane protein
MARSTSIVIRRRALGIVTLALAGSATARAETKLTLAGAQELALRRRSEIAQADLEVRLAGLERLRAGLRRVRVDAGGQWREQLEQRNAGAPAQLCADLEGLCRPLSRTRVLELSANLEVPLWSGFGLEAEWARAGQLQRAARAQQRARAQALKLEIARAYWTVRWAELLHEAGARALARRAEVAATIRARFDGGLVPRSDQARAEAALLRQQADLAELEGRAVVARAELAAALQLAGEVSLTDSPPEQALPLPPLAQVLAEAARRPELELAAARTQAQLEEKRAIESAYWPQVSLFAQAGASNEVLGVAQDGLVSNFSAGLSVSWRALDGLLTWQAARAAGLEQHKRALDQQRLRALIEAEARVAHARLATALARRAPLVKARALAESTVALLRRRYQAGGALLIELLDAEDELHALDAAVVSQSVEAAEAQAALAAARGES